MLKVRAVHLTDEAHCRAATLWAGLTNDTEVSVNLAQPDGLLSCHVLTSRAIEDDEGVVRLNQFLRQRWPIQQRRRGYSVLPLQLQEEVQAGAPLQAPTQIVG